MSKVKIKIANYEYGAYSLAEGDSASADILAWIHGGWACVGYIDINADHQTIDSITSSSGDRYSTSNITATIFDDEVCSDEISVDLFHYPKRRNRSWLHGGLPRGTRVFTSAEAKREIKRRVSEVVTVALDRGHNFNRVFR